MYTVLTASVGVGMLRQGAGVVAPVDSNDYVIYDTSTGALYYDADAWGSASTPVQIAVLYGAPALSAADIVVT